MLCQFEKIIYPPNPAQVDPGSYMIALYRPCEKIKDASGHVLTQVKAVGYCLPVANHLRYEMQGHWSKHQNHGLQFEVESYDEVLIPSKEGIIAYLSSGKIKGIGPKVAERIYEKTHDAQTVAKCFQVSTSTVYRLSGQMKKTGSVELQTSQRGRKPALTEEDLQGIDQL